MGPLQAEPEETSSAPLADTPCRVEFRLGRLSVASCLAWAADWDRPVDR